MLLTLMSALGCWLAISSIVSNCTEQSVLLRHSYFRTKENEKELSTNLRFLEYAGPQWLKGHIYCFRPQRVKVTYRAMPALNSGI